VLAVAAVMITGCQSLETLTSKSEGISQKRKQRNLAAAQRFDQKRDWAELEAAQARWAEGDLDGCAETLRHLLARNPDHLEARLLMAEALLAANRPKEAIPLLEPAVAAHPNDARVHHLMGMLLDGAGQRVDASGLYEQAASLEPDNEVYRVSYETLATSDEPPRQPGDIAQGLPIPTPVPLPVKPEPISPDFFRAPIEGGAPSDSPAMPLAEPAEMPAPGTALPRESASEDPTPLGVLAAEPSQARPLPASEGDPRTPGRSEVSDTPGSGAAELFVSDEDPLEGVEGAGSIGEYGPADGAETMSASDLLERGRSALSRGTVALGFAYFREAMALRPDDPQIPTEAAVCALRQNQPDLAVSLLEPLLEAFPDSAAIRRILAAAHYRLGNYKSSQVILRQALSLDNSSALSYFLMGCTLVKLGQPVVAESCFRQARRLDPRYPPNR
jgi:Flp pilus assembly protein TadD